MLPKIIAILEKVSKVRPNISVTRMVETKNSTDFAMGRRPKLKSEEFFVSTILVIEIIANLCLKPPKKK